jgi:hypothetical protein
MEHSEVRGPSIKLIKLIIWNYLPFECTFILLGYSEKSGLDRQ